MPHPDQTSKLPKWPFLVADAALLGAAWLIAARSRSPLPTEATLSIAACVIVATIVGVIPFLADYARRQEEVLDERQRALESLAHTVSAAAEQISIAVRGFQEISELAQKNLKEAEQLPPKPPPELTARRSVEAERIEAAADKVTRAAADWVRLEAASQKHLAAAQAVLVELNSAAAIRAAAMTKADKPVPALVAAALTKPEAPASIPSPAVASKVETPAKPDKPAAGHADLSAEAPAKAEGLAPSQEPILPIGDAASPAAEVPPKTSRKRAPKKPPETPLPPIEPAFVELQPALRFTPAAADDASPTVSFAADGATRLLVTAYIGIGNRLFIRGDGPGLSWERGAPLQFVSIGKWRWETTDASAPVNFKLYKNDEIECTALESRPLDPGQQQEVVATF